MLTVGYVHPGGLSHGLHSSIGRLLILGETHEVAVKSGPLISRARNDVVGAFVNGLPDSEHLLMVDTDIEFYPQDVQALIDTDLPIVSGLYVGLHPDGKPFPVAKVKNPAAKGCLTMEWSDLPKSGVTPIMGAGMGFCLIKREVLEALQRKRPNGKLLWPFEEWEYGGVVYGEDVTFCIRAKELGFQTYLNVDVQVGHVKNGMLMPKGFMQ